MSDLVADGLNISINRQEALDWLSQFLGAHKFSYPAAEKDRAFALVLIQALKNENLSNFEFGDTVEDVDGATGRVIGVKEDGSVRYQNPSWGIDEAHRDTLRLIRKWYDTQG